MDIRGAGNLLGEEQSGHVREVGIELYQEMLEEAVSRPQATAATAAEVAEQWSPQINLGASVLIPETMSPTSMSACRSIAASRPGSRRAEIDRFAAELIDRFGAAAGRGQEPARDRRHQAAVPARPGWRRSMPAPRAGPSPSATTLRQSEQAGRVHQPACRHHEGAARPEAGLHPRLGDPQDRSRGVQQLMRAWRSWRRRPLGRYRAAAGDVVRAARGRAGAGRPAVRGRRRGRSCG